MTDKKSRRVVIINNINSDSIDQAIFILKSDPSAPQKAVNSGIAKEAQAIIDNYIRQVERLKGGHGTNTAVRPYKKHPRILLTLLAAVCAVCVGLSLTVFHILG